MTKPIQVYDGDGRSPEELAAEEATRLRMRTELGAYAKQMGQVNVQIQSTQITSKRRKLKMQWSAEAEKELNDMYGIDLSKALAAEVQRAAQSGVFDAP